MSSVKIIDCTPEYYSAFRLLNEEWIRKYFKMEPEDYKVLLNPEEYIINKGGSVLVALVDDRPAGVCALIKKDNENYELAKMAVSPEVRGKGLGNLLGNAVIERAKSLGAKRLYLESNTILEKAINLYRKLGFKEIPLKPSPYSRSNIQMELIL